MICSPGGELDLGDFCRDPSLMWSSWMSARFNLKRTDIVRENLSLTEIVGMWDSLKES